MKNHIVQSLSKSQMRFRDRKVDSENVTCTPNYHNSSAKSPERKNLMEDFNRSDKIGIHRRPGSPAKTDNIRYVKGKFEDSLAESENQSTVDLRSNNKKTSFLSSLHLKPIVRDFYSRVEQIILISKFSDQGRRSELKSLIYKCLEEIIIDPELIEIETNIGRGSSSEVYSGTYMYSPVAIKKLRIDDYTERQLVKIDLL